MVKTLLLLFAISCEALAQHARHSAKPQPVPLQITGVESQLVYIVEQQTQEGRNQTDPSLWVTNNTSCTWSFDDYKIVTYRGYLDPGASVTYRDCQIADAVWHIARVSAIADLGSSFSLSLTADDGVGHVTVTNGPATTIQNGLRKNQLASYARVLLWTQEYNYNGTNLTYVAGSGSAPNSKYLGIYGGLGHRIELAYTITNTGTTTIKNVTFTPDFEYNYVQDEPQWCAAEIADGGALFNPKYCTNPYPGDSWSAGNPQVCWCGAGSVSIQ